MISKWKNFVARIKDIFRIFNTYITTRTSVIIRNVFLIIVIFIFVSISVSFVVFWAFRKGAPEVSVPKVTGKDLIEGLIVLQKKNLRVIVDPRYFSNYPKNTIVDQDPKPGSVVREGKDIKLIVSKGPIVSIVEDYTGKTFAYVQNRLQEIFSFQGKSIKIGNVTYVTSDSPKGTIVGQFPPPDTPIGNVDAIDLIVSQGKQVEAFYLKDYSGKKINDVMQIMALKGILVHVIPEEIVDPEKNGMVLSQDPPEGTLVNRNDTITLYVGYLPSETGKKRLYARVVNFDVPKDIKKEEVPVRILIKDRVGEREVYNAVNKPGDSISIPFKSYSPTSVFIYVNNGLFEIRKIE